MLRKGIDDIRLLRSTDPRLQTQMHDLEPYHPVSVMPPATRDLSVAMDDVPDPVLPPQAIARLGMRPDQYNVLLRVVLRSLHRTLTAEEANTLRDRIYAEVHAGTVHHWASVHPPT